MARIGNVDDGRSVRRLHVRDVECRAVNPNLTAARAVQVRHEAGVGLARHWQLERVPVAGGAAGRKDPSRVGAHTILTMSPAASRPHFLNRWKHFNAGSSLATNKIAGRFSSPLMCSNQEPPGTARLSNFSQSKRLPSMIECPLPSNGATSRLAVCRTGRVFSPGRSTCAKNVMVLNTGPPVSGSVYSIDSAS